MALVVYIIFTWALYTLNPAHSFGDYLVNGVIGLLAYNLIFYIQELEWKSREKKRDHPLYK